MKIYLALLIGAIMMGSLKTNAQAPAIQWQKSLGGSNSDQKNVGQRYVQTSDGGYIVAGQSSSINGDVTGNHGADDYWVVKLDGSGNLSWQKALGGSSFDFANSIQQTDDGGYIVAGYSSSNNGDVTGNHGDGDYWVVKLDASGNITWQKSLGGSNDDLAYSIQQTGDGGYIVAGYSQSTNGDVTGNHGSIDYWIVKLDGSGNLTWQKSLGGSQQDIANSIQQTTDGGYIVAGFTFSTNGDVTGNHGFDDHWIVKLNSSGSITWQKSLGGNGSDRANSIQQTTDGGYIVAGHSGSTNGDVTGNHGGDDYWIVKLDGSGNITWQKSLGGSGFDIANSIQQTADGGYIIAGYSFSTNGDITGNHGNYDYWVVKLDGSGNLNWQKSLGGSGEDVAYSIQQTTDGWYILAGYSQSTNGDVTGNHGIADFWVVKLGPVCTTFTSSSTPVTTYGGTDGTATVNHGIIIPMPSYLWNNSQTTRTATGLSAGTYSVTVTRTDFDTNVVCTTTVSAVVTQPPPPQADSWVQKANAGGTGRYYAASFVIGSKGYMGTGYNGSFLNDFWEYDQATDTWSQKANFSGSPRFRAAGFTIGSKGYIGTGNDGGVFLSDFYEYDPASNMWTQKANFGGGVRYLASAFGIGSKGYMGLGYDGSIQTTDFWEYDPAGNSWTAKAAFTGSARSSASCFTIGTKGYVGTGYPYTSDFREYDPSTNSWTQKANFPGTGREAAVGFSIGTKGYIGTGNDGNSKKDFYEYDPSTDNWLQKSDFGGTARYGAFSFSINSKGYIGSGFDGSYKSDFWEYITFTCNITATANATPVSTFGGTDGTVTVSASNGAPPYTYLWDNTATTSSVINLPAGTYNVTVTDATACTATASATITEPSCTISVSATSTPINPSGGSNGTATATVSSGVAPFFYLWSNGESTSTITGLPSGNYDVTVTDSGNCGTATASVTVYDISAIPTLSEWGLIALGVLVVCMALVFVRKMV